MPKWLWKAHALKRLTSLKGPLCRIQPREGPPVTSPFPSVHPSVRWPPGSHIVLLHHHSGASSGFRKSGLEKVSRKPRRVKCVKYLAYKKPYFWRTLVSIRCISAELCRLRTHFVINVDFAVIHLKWAKVHPLEFPCLGFPCARAASAFDPTPFYMILHLLYPRFPSSSTCVLFHCDLPRSQTTGKVFPRKQG